MLESASETCTLRAGLGVLRDVQRAYESRLEQLEQSPGPDKFKLQVDLLRSWVGDLVAQNSLLVGAVEGLEKEATRLLREIRMHAEMRSEPRYEVCKLRRRLARKDNDLRGLIQVLRRLRDCDSDTDDVIHFFEVTKSDIYGTVEWRGQTMKGSATSGVQLPKDKPRARRSDYPYLIRDSSRTPECDTVADLKMQIVSLQDEIILKDREICRLTCEDRRPMHLNIRDEEQNSLNTDEVPMKDEEVTADVTDRVLEATEDDVSRESRPIAEFVPSGGGAPVAHIQLSVRRQSVRALRWENECVWSEVSWLRRLCALLLAHGRVQRAHLDTRDHIIRVLGKRLRRAVDKAGCSRSVVPPPPPTQEHRVERIDHSLDVIVIEQEPPPLVTIDDSTVAPASPPRTPRTPRTAPRDNRELQEIFKRQTTCGCKDGIRKPKCRRDVHDESPVSGYGGGSSSGVKSSSPCDERVRNLEATLRVQQASLSVAESRVAALVAANRKLLDDRDRTLKSRSGRSKAAPVKADVSVSADAQELEKQKGMVKTLQSNLSVIEDLYKECFYETARQDDLIESLRSACADIRQIEKESSARVSEMETVVDTQRWSLQRCQLIAEEVENLKVEITNFLSSSSNNDSGTWGLCWEGGEAGEAGEASEARAALAAELREVGAQLAHLHTLLSCECCSCGLQEENNKLKEQNEKLTTQTEELQHRIRDLEQIVLDKDSAIRQYQEQVETKESEVKGLYTHISELEVLARESEHALCERDSITEELREKLHDSTRLLSAKQSELKEAQQQSRHLADTARTLQRDLAKAEHAVEERSSLQLKVSEVTGEVSALRRALDEERARADHLRALYRSACGAARAGAAGGGALCARTRALLHDLRRWTARAARSHRLQEEKIMEQESIISELQSRLTMTVSASSSEEACCSRRGGRQGRTMRPRRSASEMHTHSTSRTGHGRSDAPCGDEECACTAAGCCRSRQNYSYDDLTVLPCGGSELVSHLEQLCAATRARVARRPSRLSPPPTRPPRTRHASTTRVSAGPSRSHHTQD